MKTLIIGFTAIVFSVGDLSGQGSGEGPQLAADRLVRACDIYDEKAMRTSCEQLVGFGEPALAVVVSLLDHGNANVRWQSARVVGELGLICDGLENKLAAACRDRDADVRAAAIGPLVKLYPQAENSGSIAVELCEDPHDLVRANAWMARWLLNEDNAAPGRLAAHLSSKDWMVSRAAQDHLVAIGKPAVPAVVDLVADAESAGCVAAVQVIGPIGDLGTRKSSFIAMLEGHATCDDDTLVAPATLALANLGSGAQGVLRRLSVHVDSHVRTRALTAMATRTRASADQMLPVFKKALRDPSTAVRIVAIDGIGRTRCCGNDVEIGQVLTRFLADPNPDIRGATIAALGMLGGRSLSAAVPQLGLIADSDPKDYLRAAARELLARDFAEGGCSF